MADLDFRNRNEFRKGSQIRLIDEDPTYLSFVLLFHFDDHPDVGHSPLLDGKAERYLRDVVRDDVGEQLGDNLKNFVRVLRKVNVEMPWFWQGLKGLDAALNYGDMTEPWRGAEKPVLEITCLEENMELTAIGLMDLYKRACFDFERYVEVVPRNLREFSLDIIVSEIRVFQKDTNSRNLGLTDNEDSVFNNSSNSAGGTVTEQHQNYVNKDFTSADVTPFIRLRFTHCEFDYNSIADYFAELTKNPEAAQPVLKINWGTCRQIDQKLGANLFNEKVNADKPINKRIEDAQKIGRIDNGAGQTTGQKYLDAIRGRTLDKVESVLADTKDAVTAQANSIANSFANPDQPGLVKNLLDKGVEDLTGALLLGNVHGLGGTINDITTAIKTGSLNAVGNLVGNLVGNNNRGEGGADVGGLGNVGLDGSDSTPDNIKLGKIYDVIEDGIGQPESPLGKDNVHGNTAPDNDGPINENVHE